MVRPEIVYLPAAVFGWLAQTWPRMVFGTMGDGAAKTRGRKGAETRRTVRLRQCMMGTGRFQHSLADEGAT